MPDRNDIAPLPRSQQEPQEDADQPGADPTMDIQDVSEEPMPRKPGETSPGRMVPDRAKGRSPSEGADLTEETERDEALGWPTGQDATPEDVPRYDRDVEPEP